MFWRVKQLSSDELDICHKTLSPRATFALVGDAVAQRKGISIVRMGDGELGLLNAKNGEPFNGFDHIDPKSNERLGFEGLEIAEVKKLILEAGNTCTYFAPSVSGISKLDYMLHDRFLPREYYLDNFFVNDWSKKMVHLLLEASDGVFVIHKEYQLLIDNFATHYDLSRSHFAGFAKMSWRDNDEAVAAAVGSDKQLVLFSAGPAGKVIGPKIAKAGKVVLDIGNTLPQWSVGTQAR